MIGLEEGLRARPTTGEEKLVTKVTEERLQLGNGFLNVVPRSSRGLQELHPRSADAHEPLLREHIRRESASDFRSKVVHAETDSQVVYASGVPPEIGSRWFRSLAGGRFDSREVFFVISVDTSIRYEEGMSIQVTLRDNRGREMVYAWRDHEWVSAAGLQDDLRESLEAAAQDQDFSLYAQDAQNSRNTGGDLVLSGGTGGQVQLVAGTPGGAGSGGIVSITPYVAGELRRRKSDGLLIVVRQPDSYRASHVFVADASGKAWAMPVSEFEELYEETDCFLQEGSRWQHIHHGANVVLVTSVARGMVHYLFDEDDVVASMAENGFVRLFRMYQPGREKPPGPPPKTAWERILED